MPGAHLPDWVGDAAALSVLLAIAYVQFRHFVLALLVALAPLPGGMVAVWLGAGPPALVYLAGYFIATFLAALISARICEGEDVKAATGHAWRSGRAIYFGSAALGVLTAGLPSVLALKIEGSEVVGAIFISCICSALVIPCARIVSFSSEFVTRANRAREARERWLDRLSFVIQPRWGWSIGGIALIFAILGFFGAHWSVAAKSLNLFTGVALISIGVGYLFVRDVRRLLAFVLSAAVLFLILMWIGAGASLPAWPCLLLMSVTATPLLVMAMQSSAFAREGDNAAVASLRAFESFAATIAIYGVGAALALLVACPVSTSALLICGVLAALIVLPALTTVIFDLFPPRLSPDAYRIG